MLLDNEVISSFLMFFFFNLADDIDETQQQSWAWGQFPTNVSQKSSPTSETSEKQNQRESMLSSMFSFMKQNKHRRAPSEGVYLADLSSGSVDPEVAAMYFNTNKKQEAG